MPKRFDAVAFQRRRREEISREIETLGWDAWVRKMRRDLRRDPLWRSFKGRGVRLRGLRDFVTIGKP